MNGRRLFVYLLVIVAIVMPALYAAPAQAAEECVSLSQTLRVGSTNATTFNAVGQLQTFLRNHHYFSGLSSGIFGPKTAYAVKLFQIDQHLAALGFVGPGTRAAIQRVSCAPVVAVAPTTPIATAVPTPSVVATTTTAAEVSQLTLPYHPSMLSNWTTLWGTVASTSNGGLQLLAATTSTGAEAVLAGASNWTDYRYMAQVNVTHGDITLIGRYVDNDNYMACAFSGNWVAIIEHSNGQSNTVASATVPDLPAGQNFARDTSVVMNVKGNTVGCIAFGGENNVTYTIPASDSKLLKGSIGIETWHSVLGAAALTLKSVTVDPL